MLSHRFAFLVLMLSALLPAGCGDPATQTPQDKLFDAIVRILLYTMGTVFFAGVILPMAGIELGKKARIIIAAVALVAFTAVTFLPVGTTLPGIK